MVPTCDGPREVGAAQALDLGLYLDGVLPEAHARTVELHLVQCEPCRLRLRDFRDLKAALEDRALWRARGKDDSGLGVGTSCLSAAEMLLALEKRSSARAEQHLAICAVCTNDVLSIEESTEEHATGRLERPAPELVEVLRSVGKQGSGIDISDASDPLAPIIIMPTQAGSAALPDARTASKRVSRRIAPRHPSKRMSSASMRATSSRNVSWAGGAFTFAAAAAAAVIVGLLVTQGGPVERPSNGGPSNGEVAKKPVVTPVAPRVQPAPKTPAKKPVVNGQQGKPEDPDAPVDERVDPPAPQSPFEVAPSPEAQTPPGDVTAQNPGTQSNPNTGPSSPSQQPAVSQKPAVAPDLAKAPLPLDAPVTDDGARIELDLARLSGGIAVKNGSGSDTEKWASIAKKDGRLALKPGDRIRSTSGALLSLDGGTYELSLAAKSELVVRGLAGGPVMGLTEGRVLCEVEKLTDKHLVIATNSADFECTGTVFSVSADSNKALCAVEEGTVVCRAPQGEPRALVAGYALTVARGEAPGEPKPSPADVNAWASSVRPERDIVYFANFDRGDLSGFSGSLTDQGVFRGVGRSLAFEPLDDKNNKFWGLAARAPKGKIKNWKPTLDMRIQFSIWLEKESHVLLQVMNERQTKYFKRDFGAQPGNRWLTLTVPVMDLETYYDPGKSPMRESDLVSEVEVYTGDPGDKWKALLDDVTVYRKRYR